LLKIKREDVALGVLAVVEAAQPSTTQSKPSDSIMTQKENRGRTSIF